MNVPTSGRLSDYGERRLVADHLFRRYGKSVPNFGDDSALVLRTPGGCVIATTDPAPQPVAWQLGIEDYYYWGWLLAAINLSDIAAAGGAPLGMLSSLTLPNEMLLTDLNRLLDGIDDCCATAGTGVIGGNLKEASDGTVRCEGTALGWVKDAEPLSRSGASIGDVIVAFGPTGAFWSAVLARSRGVTLENDDLVSLTDVVLKPVPQVLLGGRLREARLLHCCTDASDGIYAAVRSLTVEQGSGALLDVGEWEYPDAVVRSARRLGVDPVRLALGFGDLQLVGTTTEEKLSDVIALSHETNVHVMVLGRVTPGSDLSVRTLEQQGVLSNFDNERFTSESQFTGGLEAYWTRLLQRPLVRSGG